jgi:glycosidase
MAWPKHPIIYEINTWVWLNELSRRYKKSITLDSIPDSEWDAIADLQVDAVWLMGVWERSTAGIRIARELPVLQEEYRRALPGFTREDVAGSPYCVHRYVVDEHLGGPKCLAKARKELAKRNMRLILDFVPNHVAPDHPWVLEHPEYFIQGSADDCAQKTGEFFRAGDKIIACGRDPYFPPWTDTAQVNAFHPGLRKAAIETVSSIASQCDGMRCDMAMLLISNIFEKTWGQRAGVRQETEYWQEILQAVRKQYPETLFMAEAYWGLEWELQQQGFNYCYDKRLYDRLVHDNAESVRLHLLADRSYQDKLVRFIENHDEPRAAATFPAQKQRAAAVTILTLPGAKLLHEGQFAGCRVKLPVQLGRRPIEPADGGLQTFYQKLLKAVNSKAFREGEWQLCERSGWPDNQSYKNLVAWCWSHGNERYLIILNLSDARAQGRVLLCGDELSGRMWQLTDLFTNEVYERYGSEMLQSGLFVDLAPWGVHFFSFT